MSAIILSNNSEETNVSEMIYRERFVSGIYLGTGTSSGLLEIWSDPEALHHYYISEDTSPNRFTTKTFSTELNPIEVTGKTFEDVEGYLHSGGKTVSYGYIDDTVYTELDFGSTKYRCDISVDGVAASGYNIVIPENTKPYGVVHKITWASSGLSRVTNEYQTSDSHALFGLESDSKLSIDYASARNYLTRTSGIYTVSQPGTLVFRPLQECQLNFTEPVGYYYVSEHSTIYDLHADLSGTYSITSLPTEETAIESDPYLSAGFQYIPDTIKLTPGNTYLLGFCGETSFQFSDNFTATLNTSTIQPAGGGVYVMITTTSNTSWSVTSSDSWVTVGTASGTGNGNVLLSADKNTTGKQRSATIVVTNTTSGTRTLLAVYQQPYAGDVLTFGSAPAGWHLTANPNNTWTFEEDSATSTASRTLYSISFVPSKNGTITLSGSAGIMTCDETLVGAAISTNSSFYNAGNSIPLCDGDEVTTSMSVTAGTTYYIQALRDDSTTGDTYMITLDISFS